MFRDYTYVKEAVSTPEKYQRFTIALGKTVIFIISVSFGVGLIVGALGSVLIYAFVK